MKLVIFIFFVFLALSCSKEADEPSLKWGERMRIKKIIMPGNARTFIYNEKGLLTQVVSSSVAEISYEITYNGDNLPVKIVPFNKRLAPSYYLITWGENQFTFTKMPQENNAYFSGTTYTLNENKIDKIIFRRKANDGSELTWTEQCTWIGDDRLYVDSNYQNERTEYKFIGLPSIFKNINLAVCYLTRLSLFTFTYQNNKMELALNGNELLYRLYDFRGPLLLYGFRNETIQFEYEEY